LDKKLNFLSQSLPFDYAFVEMILQLDEIFKLEIYLYWF